MEPIALRWSNLGGFFQAASKELRADLARQVRLLMAAGEPTWISSSEPAVAPVLLELLRTLEPGLPRSLGESTLQLNVLLLDGLPIAGMICGGSGGTLYALQLVFAPGAQQLGAGTMLLLLSIDGAIAAGCHALDLHSGFAVFRARSQRPSFRLTTRWLGPAELAALMPFSLFHEPRGASLGVAK